MSERQFSQSAARRCFGTALCQSSPDREMGARAPGPWCVIRVALSLAPFCSAVDTFEEKDTLRECGHRWRPDGLPNRKVWWTTCPDPETEVSWLRSDVYRFENRIPVQEVTSLTRFSDRMWKICVETDPIIIAATRNIWRGISREQILEPCTGGRVGDVPRDGSGGAIRTPLSNRVHGTWHVSVS